MLKIYKSSVKRNNVPYVSDMPNKIGVFLFYCTLDAINYTTYYFMYYYKMLSVKVGHKSTMPSIVGCILILKILKYEKNM